MKTRLFNCKDPKGEEMLVRTNIEPQKALDHLIAIGDVEEDSFTEVPMTEGEIHMPDYFIFETEETGCEIYIQA